MKCGPKPFKGSNRPVEKVSWEDAQVFLTRLNAIEAVRGYIRLPMRLEICFTHRGGVGVCLPGRHDHGVLVG